MSELLFNVFNNCDLVDVRCIFCDDVSDSCKCPNSEQFNNAKNAGLRFGETSSCKPIKLRE